MGKIRRLANDLANQIAAGEVVERPASVVKELVENAIDAGSTRIQITIEQGGATVIRVVDDGEGMTREDAQLALERHATSKIQHIDDLKQIGTFGFRGEALPSIGSVARLTLTTRARGESEGTELVVEGGGEPTLRPVGTAVGTTVDVRDLFFNVPARRKFLKARGTESAHVGEVVLLAALARPEITFVFTRDGKVAREYLRAPSRRERALTAFGDERLEPCICSRGALSIEAYLSAPERARAGANGLHLFVNGRPVRDRSLARAVAQSYGSVLEAGRYPVGALFVDLPPEFVDVNVHPQKAEVRFADSRGVCDAIARELHGLLAKAFSFPASGPLFRRGPPSNPLSSNTGLISTRKSHTDAAPQSGLDWTFSQEASSSGAVALSDPWSLGLPPNSPATASTVSVVPSEYDTEPSMVLAVVSSEEKSFGHLQFLAQLRLTFLLCEASDGLYILDQHAAAERVTFDRLRRAYASRTIATQQLLIAEVVSLAPLEVACIEEHAASIERLGIDVRPLGMDAVAVHAVPKILAKAHPERIVRDLVAELSHVAKRPFSDAADLVLATMACHGSIRAGDRVSPEEANALLRALDAVEFAGHCPHGRPVVTCLRYEELERRVGRI